eukprot:7404425-Pyramimonas_sp.AAC.1
MSASGAASSSRVRRRRPRPRRRRRRRCCGRCLCRRPRRLCARGARVRHGAPGTARGKAASH